MKTPEWFKQLAIPIVNKIVYASDAYVDLKSTLIDLSPQLISFERSSTNPSDLRLLEFAHLIRPMTGPGLRKIRVGSSSDGGYIMADDFDVEGAISVGIGSNVSWDQVIASRRIPIAMFDPTIRRLPESVPGGHFYRIGLGNSDTGTAYKTLAALVDVAGFSSFDSLLLKIDVEGSEYAAITCVSASELCRYRQIIIEYHDLFMLKNEQRASLIIDAVRKLSTNHFPVHVHANNFDSMIRFGNYWFPNAIEVTYTLKSALPNAIHAKHVRDDADSPCDVRVPEIDLEALARLVREPNE